MTKAEELSSFKAWGMEDILQNTWFCHHPIKGKPCGYCSPCRQVVAGHMSFRLPTSAKIRHRFAYVFLFWNDKLKPMIGKIRKEFQFTPKSNTSK